MTQSYETQFCGQSTAIAHVPRVGRAAPSPRSVDPRLSIEPGPRHIRDVLVELLPQILARSGEIDRRRFDK